MEGRKKREGCRGTPGQKRKSDKKCSTLEQTIESKIIYVYKRESMRKPQAY